MRKRARRSELTEQTSTRSLTTPAVRLVRVACSSDLTDYYLNGAPYANPANCPVKAIKTADKAHRLSANVVASA